MEYKCIWVSGNSRLQTKYRARPCRPYLWPQTTRHFANKTHGLHLSLVGDHRLHSCYYVVVRTRWLCPVGVDMSIILQRKPGGRGGRLRLISFQKEYHLTKYQYNHAELIQLFNMTEYTYI